MTSQNILRFSKHDGGRRAAGYKGLVNDCTVRAVAIANSPRPGVADGAIYKETYLAASRHNKANGGPRSARNGINNTSGFLTDRGWTMIEPAGRWMTVAEVAAEHPNCIVTVVTPRGKSRPHLAAVVGGMLFDTWDCQFNQWNQGQEWMRVTEIWTAD